MSDYLKDLFSWEGQWTRFKFWVYPLPLIVIYLALTGFLAFSSLEWYTNDAKQSFIKSEESNIAKEIELASMSGIELSESSPEMLRIKERQNTIEEMKGQVANNTEDGENRAFIRTLSSLLSILAFIYMYVSIAAYVKRLRDLWKSPWMVLLMFIPLANIYLFIICGFFEG